ncbi:hypothetical protein NDU88_003724 [Pleurodeles waltl]|uniref:Uncharacterized protein n=1 Tax=Pleurodeles waltl TaxID=8319 RepID=A0AAV7LHW0_PLEWA|nr:hypothetical protein NDU88_003724 [Pleurodeles waltl]
MIRIKTPQPGEVAPAIDGTMVQGLNGARGSHLLILWRALSQINHQEPSRPRTACGWPRGAACGSESSACSSVWVLAECQRPQAVVSAQPLQRENRFRCWTGPGALPRLAGSISGRI